MDVNDGDREKLLMPLSNESELSMTAGKPSVPELFIVKLLHLIVLLIAYY